MAPVFAKKALKERFSTPIDLGKEFRGKRIAGNNKTFRGFLSAILISICIVILQKQLYASGTSVSWSVVDYTNINYLGFGFLMGFGAMFGDFSKSVIKRRLDKEPGQTWRPFDQIDFVLGAVLITSILYVPPLSVIFGMLIFVPLIKVLVDNIGFYLKIYDQRW
jgi:CDP-2,3-bis-(O-geranylgeranyl)-sn-glycerol synthase